VRWGGGDCRHCVRCHRSLPVVTAQSSLVSSSRCRPSSSRRPRGFVKSLQKWPPPRFLALINLPAAGDWMSTASERASERLAVQYGAVCSPLGRRRRLRQHPAWTHQSSVSEMTLAAWLWLPAVQRRPNSTGCGLVWICRLVVPWSNGQDVGLDDRPLVRSTPGRVK